MKKIIGGLFLMLVTLTVQSQSAEEILTKYEAAVGGREKLEAVNQLQVFSNLKTNLQ